MKNVGCTNVQSMPLCFARSWLSPCQRPNCTGASGAAPMPVDMTMCLTPASAAASISAFFIAT